MKMLEDKKVWMAIFKPKKDAPEEEVMASIMSVLEPLLNEDWEPPGSSGGATPTSAPRRPTTKTSRSSRKPAAAAGRRSTAKPQQRTGDIRLICIDMDGARGAGLKQACRPSCMPAAGRAVSIDAASCSGI